MSNLPSSRGVSIIIPTYNRALYLGLALKSVVDQEHVAPLEAIVIDDGSTDDTKQVIEPWLRQYADPAARVWIRYERRDNQGVVAARNRGIELASQPYLAFLDSDDEWLPGKLRLQFAAMQAMPGSVLCHTSFRYIDASGAFTDDGPQRFDNPCVGSCMSALLDECLVIFSSVLVKRQTVQDASRDEEHGLPFDPRWVNGEDYDLTLRCARFGPIAYVKEPVTHYRVHGAQAMGNLKRAFGFHCRVQMDFVRRHGKEIGFDSREARERAGRFLFRRADAAFWKRDLKTALELCDLAKELGVEDSSIENLRRRAKRPVVVYRAKDWIDKVLRRKR